jgi:hypothetical protein
MVDGEHFLAEHASLQESSAGTVIVEARRHLRSTSNFSAGHVLESGGAKPAVYGLSG